MKLLNGKSMVVGMALMCIMGIQSAFAGAIINLADHPDGSERPPAYGLRLDGLFSGDSTKEWTFSFDDVTMIVDDLANTVRIFGSVTGGEDLGATRNDHAWYLDFLYQDDLTINADNTWSVGGSNTANLNNSGTLTLLSDVDLDGDTSTDAGKSIGLVEFMGAEFAANGYRCAGHYNCGPLVGIGWLNHTIDFITAGSAPSSWANTGTHLAASDFIYTVSEPPLFLMMGLGLAGLVLTRRRMK